MQGHAKITLVVAVISAFIGFIGASALYEFKPKSIIPQEVRASIDKKRPDSLHLVSSHLREASGFRLVDLEIAHAQAVAPGYIITLEQNVNSRDPVQCHAFERDMFLVP